MFGQLSIDKVKNFSEFLFKELQNNYSEVYAISLALAEQYLLDRKLTFERHNHVQFLINHYHDIFAEIKILNNKVFIIGFGQEKITFNSIDDGFNYLKKLANQNNYYIDDKLIEL